MAMQGDPAAEGEQPIVVIGLGHAGMQVTALLRQGGCTGEIIAIEADATEPYQRPPLSKKFNWPDHLEPLKPADFFTGQRIEAIFDRRVVGLERQSRRVRLSDGTAIGYRKLVIATGARAVVPDVAGFELAGVQTLRTLDDVAVLRKAAVPGAHLLIIGGGYIGLEVAATAAAEGVEVTIVEREAQLLARTASPRFAAEIERMQRALGVRVRCATTVTELQGGPQVRAARLSDGSTVAVDAVLVGVGVVPNSEPAVAAGIDCRNGIVVDRSGRTSDPDVFAIGDVTSRPLPDGSRARLESIPSAVEQAKAAAAAILGEAPAPLEVPWFWSDQCDHRIKVAGLLDPARELDVFIKRSGEPDSLTVLHVAGDQLVCAETVNSAVDFMAARKFIKDGRQLDRRLLGEPDIPLKDSLLTKVRNQS